ncbi:hypothetical protein L798_11055 [Zootermopsis nevadensis]|uniref:Uncharacterized protein n=1 Tax=Zootermopsis nevadensis TaxID=136037 RepID=A0A067R9K5_ZOONE|nr:hypothetical protein L798_11055 [Zootermopsis nevadensis]
MWRPSGCTNRSVIVPGRTRPDTTRGYATTHVKGTFSFRDLQTTKMIPRATGPTTPDKLLFFYIADSNPCWQPFYRLAAHRNQQTHTKIRRHSQYTQNTSIHSNSYTTYMINYKVESVGY